MVSNFPKCHGGPPPNSYVGILTSKAMALGGRAFGSLMNGTGALIRDLQRAPHPFTMGPHGGKTTIYDPGSEFSPDPKSASTSLFDFRDSRTVTLNRLLFTTQPAVVGYRSPSG